MQWLTLWKKEPRKQPALRFPFHRTPRLCLLLPCVGLWISTVYLRYHYFVDLAAGLVVALLALWITYRMGHAGTGGVLAEDCVLDEAEAEPEVAARA